MTEELVGYRGEADIHDGTVLALQRGGDQVRVVVRGATGRRYEIAFPGVGSIEDHHAVGMLLYALAEMTSKPPLRRFVFVNWDEDDDARLEVAARDFGCRLLPDE